MDPVICPAILFCDGIIREEGTGKFTIIGSFQFFNAAGYPLLVPGFSVLVILDNIQPGIKELRVAIRLESSESGLTIGSALANVGMPQGYDPTGTLDIPFRLPQVAFPHAGKYELVVLVNNEIVGQRRLIVKPISATQQSNV
jgi:hypothetical protein